MEDHNWNAGLRCACKSGLFYLVKIYVLEHGANDWNGGFISACIGGHIDVAEYMISKGADNLCLGAYMACRNGHLPVLKYLINAGCNLDSCLYHACQGGHTEIVTYLTEIGAKDYKWGLEGACQGAHYPLVLLMLQILSNINNHCLIFLPLKFFYLNDGCIQLRLLSDGISRVCLSQVVHMNTLLPLFTQLDLINQHITEEIFSVLPFRDLVPLCAQYICL